MSNRKAVAATKLNVKNPKSEARNPKQIQTPKAEMCKTGFAGKQIGHSRNRLLPLLRFVFSSFEFVSDFELQHFAFYTCGLSD